MFFRHPRAKELGILLLTVQLLILAFVFVALIYYMLIRKEVGCNRLRLIPDLQTIISEDATTTLPPTTRYHRFLPAGKVIFLYLKLVSIQLQWKIKSIRLVRKMRQFTRP